MLFIIIGCDKQNNQQLKEETSNNYQFKQDSLIKVEQEKVIADIKFGMLEKEVKSKIKKFINDSKKLEYDYGSFKSYDYLIGNYKFSEYGISDYYYENELYRFDINGDLIEWKYFETELREQVKHIYDIIETKYGEPGLSYEIPASYEMSEDYSYLIYQWNVGKKEIAIRVEDSGNNYRVNISIFVSAIVDLLKEKEKLEEKEKTKSAKEVF